VPEIPGGIIPLDYWPVVIYGLIAIAFGVFTITIGIILRPSRPDPSKLSPY